jgi:hypothetical protein
MIPKSAKGWLFLTLTFANATLMTYFLLETLVAQSVVSAISCFLCAIVWSTETKKG